MRRQGTDYPYHVIDKSVTVEAFTCNSVTLVDADTGVKQVQYFSGLDENYQEIAERKSIQAGADSVGTGKDKFPDVSDDMQELAQFLHDERIRKEKVKEVFDARSVSSASEVILKPDQATHEVDIDEFIPGHLFVPTGASVLPPKDVDTAKDMDNLVAVMQAGMNLAAGIDSVGTPAEQPVA